MRYLITTSDHCPFFTDSYTDENNFTYGCEMVVFDLFNHTYTNDGVMWQEIEIDHL